MASWRITFQNFACADDAADMAAKLRSSLFFDRSNQPKDIVIAGNDVIMKVPADKDRLSISKTCHQTFRAYGKFSGKPLVESVTTSEAASAPAAPPTPVTVTPIALDLALRSPVEDIKRSLRGLNRADTHAVLTFLALQYASQQAPPVDNLQSSNLHLKVRAATAFSLPVAEWPAKLQEHAAKAAPCVIGYNCFTCTCECGCGDLSGGTSLCFGCNQWCCGCCFAKLDYKATVRSRCHHCASVAKLPLSAQTPVAPLCGLNWYFNYPFGGTLRTNDVMPLAWVTPNRNPDMDPPLAEVEKILKRREIENNTRRALPIHWEAAFDVIARLADTDGSTTRVIINLFTFLMNKQWAQQIPLGYITTWLPQNLCYTGNVLQPPVVIHSTPTLSICPQSPYTLPDSTVSCEELETDEEDQGGLSTTTDPVVFAELLAKRRRTS